MYITYKVITPINIVPYIVDALLLTIFLCCTLYTLTIFLTDNLYILSPSPFYKPFHFFIHPLIFFCIYAFVSVLFYSNPYINEILQYMSFFVLLILHSINPPGLIMLLQMPRFRSFLWPSNIPFNIRSTSLSFIYR